MTKEEKMKIILSNDYNKLLAYLAGGLVLFFSLFQLLMEMEELIFLHSVITSFISLVLFGGTVLFTFAGYLNFKETIFLKNELGIYETPGLSPSGLFSTIKNNKATPSNLIKFLVWLFLASSLIMLISINFYLYVGL